MRQTASAAVVGHRRRRLWRRRRRRIDQGHCRRGAPTGPNAVLARERPCCAAVRRPEFRCRPSLQGGTAAITSDRNAILHSVEASMPEAMALVKLKGFIYDLGGEILESVPGMIRVRVPDPQAQKKSGGLFGWFDSGRPIVQTASGTDIELRQRRKDPVQPSRLTLTLVMRPEGGMMTAEWKTAAVGVSRSLGAYLMRLTALLSRRRSRRPLRGWPTRPGRPGSSEPGTPPRASRRGWRPSAGPCPRLRA